jgi:hypothetical protein
MGGSSARSRSANAEGAVTGRLGLVSSAWMGGSSAAMRSVALTAVGGVLDTDGRFFRAQPVRHVRLENHRAAGVGVIRLNGRFLSLNPFIQAGRFAWGGVVLRVFRVLSHNTLAPLLDHY